MLQYLDCAWAGFEVLNLYTLLNLPTFSDGIKNATVNSDAIPAPKTAPKRIFVEDDDDESDEGQYLQLLCHRNAFEKAYYKE